jgi:hypothetical protein
MTFGPSAHYKKYRNVLDKDGNPVYDSKGRRLKEEVRLADTVFNGIPQSLYFPNDHKEYPGFFKGIAQILFERGDVEGLQKRLECKGFDCTDKSSSARCCARRILFNQPDFCDPKSALELACEMHGFGVAFLPKFHPNSVSSSSAGAMQSASIVSILWERAKMSLRPTLFELWTPSHS